MSLAPDITKLAEEAARRMRLSPDKSDLNKLNIIRTVVRGAGIGQTQHDRYCKNVRLKLTEFGVRRRKALAAEKRKAAEAAREAARRYP